MVSPPDRTPLHRQLLRLVALSVVSFAVFFAGCTVESTSFGPAESSGGGTTGQPGDPAPGDPPPRTDLDCTVPEPGCLCDTEGEHLPCGQVTTTLNGQKMCGQGVSVCTNGVWDACILTGLDPLPLEEVPTGFYHTQKTQTPTPCDQNPCNPYCFHYPDGPNDAGVADSGTNLLPQDGGLGTVWDAGNACVKLTKAQACAGGKDCGEVADGCGGVVSCGPDACATAGQICGGGGVPNKCGTTPIQACTPKTAAQACVGGKNCGWVSNGCGGVVSCGTCGAGQSCGLGGANICGPNCVPKTCAQLGKNCGLSSDGCGATLNCGTCGAGQICGAYSPNVCWAPGNCSPKTQAQACANAGKNCGAVPNGCGGTLSCGACPATQICGGGGVSNVCGGNVCIPKTFAQACTSAGKDCGPISDGCGGLINCGTCQEPASCGGGGIPNKCGVNALCTGLCLKQVSCPNAGQTTSITGTVYAPNGQHPLPNVVVYVPNAPVPAFPQGITCENCAQVGGSPLVSTKTATDGTFTINNMPVGNNIPLVIQIGRWRRQITIPTVAACQNTALPASLTRLPQNKNEGDIPRIAVSTGCVDRMECVLRRMGIQDSEFTNPGGTGRVQLFKGGYCPGAIINNSTPWESDLVGSLGTLDDYDLVLFPCQANEYYYNNGFHVPFQNNIASYVNAGGRAFMTHYNYHWLLRRTPTWNSPLFSAINWTPNAWSNNGTLQGTINTGFARGLQLAQWLQLPAINASPNGFSQVLVSVTRRDFNGWDTNNTVNWLTLNNPAYPIHLTFDTPLNVAQNQKCGRVVFSDFHVYNAGGGSPPFPTGCPDGDMTPQEKLLEYMIFDLSSCVGNTPPPPPCQKLTCAQQGITCGQAGDGCGGSLTCGPACPVPTCTPKTCAQQGFNCGQVGDGCGGTLDCGTCGANQVCGGPNNATPNQCVELACVKNTCPTGSGAYCGPIPHGCEPEPPNLLLTLDRSCSMTQPAGGGKNRWQSAVGAINKLTNDYKNKMRFGLSMFPDKTGQNCLQDGPIYVPVAAGQEATIQNLLNAALSSSNTNYPNGPCVTNIDTAISQAGAHPPLSDSTRKNFIVLISDGAQAGCGNAAQKDLEIEQAIKDLYTNKKIGTFVIGFGGGVDAVALNKFALAGGYPNPAPGIDYYDAQDEASLNAALNVIAEQALAIQCDCTVPGETCGGGGIPNKCGKPCVKIACPSGPGSFCGMMPDGCGGTQPCGCIAPETCGGGGIIDKCGKPTCGAKSCQDLGIECGQAGDGCGNVIECGPCAAPLTCGGAGVPGKCGAVKVHSDGYFVRDYEANCPSGTAPYWQLWSWSAVTPGNSFLDFTVQVADAEAGLASAPKDALRFSLPPGPAALASQPVSVHQANQPPGTPDTQVGAASVDNTLQLNGRKRNANYLRVTTHLAPTSDKTQTPLLKLWDMQVDCIPSE